MAEKLTKDSLAYFEAQNVVTNAIKPSDKYIELISKYFSNVEDFNPEEIAVFEAWVSNNIIDRSMNRTPLATLKSLDRTVIGKPKLMHHNTNSEPGGRFFKSRLQEVSKENAMKLIENVPFKQAAFDKLLDISVDRDGKLYWMVSTFYMLNGTDDEKQNVRKVRYGLLRDMSLSYYVPSKVAILDDESEIDIPMWDSQREYDGKKVLFYEWRNTKEIEAESVEASHVFLGRLRGTVSQQGEDSTVENETDYLNRVSFVVNHYFGNEINTDTADIENEIEEIENQQSEKDKVENAEWTTAYINSLEDNCFAVIEPGLKKDDDGKTIPRNARHLPHHPKGKGAPGAGGTLDMPHFRNARSRMNQIKSVSGNISTADLRQKAKSHLDAHLAKLQKSEFNLQELKKMDLNIKSLNRSFPIDAENLELDLGVIVKAVNSAVANYETELSEKTEQLKSFQEKEPEYKNAVQFSESFKETFGETTIGQLKQIKNDAVETKQFLIEQVLSRKTLAGLEVAENEAENLKSLTVETLKVMYNQFTSMIPKDGKGFLENEIKDDTVIDGNGKEKDKEKAELLKSIITPKDVQANTLLDYIQ